MTIADRFKTRAGVSVWAAIVIAVGLVLLRSLVPVLYEQFDFDSDQAIVGLMAKHASELRTFPLFFYGQPYMLAVQAWIAVPFFWIGGPTLAMLRLPLVLLNALVPALVILILVRRGVGPLFALAAALPIATTTPVVSAALVETLGASVEPLVYVLLLWRLRSRPVAYGALLAAGTLHREFTIFAAPAAIVAGWIEGRPWRSTALVKAMVAFAGMWLIVAALAPMVNNLGPAGGASRTAALGDEARLVASWLSFRGAPYAARLQSLLSGGLPDLFGARPYVPLRYNVNSALTVGSHVAGVLLLVALAVCVWRLARGLTANAAWRRTAFPAYLVIIAIEAVAAYGLNAGIDPAAPAVLRYVLFALLLPVGLLGGCFLVDGSVRWRLAVAGGVAAWAVLATSDNIRVLAEYRAAAPPSEFRALADSLVAHRIRYGTAQYWDCYVVDFLSRERVVLASTGAARISAYQAVVERNAARAVQVVRQPCAGGERVASWCIEGPPAR
jgi:hypothetical protein